VTPAALCLALCEEAQRLGTSPNGTRPRFRVARRLLGPRSCVLASVCGAGPEIRVLDGP